MPSESSVMTLETARTLAFLAHSTAYRFDNVTPYIAHPDAVASLVGEDEKLKIIAWLHDVVEDTDVSLEYLASKGAPKDVLDAIEAITHEKWEPYSDYIYRVSLNPLALQVKIVDLLVNLSDQPTQKQREKYIKHLPRLIPNALLEQLAPASLPDCLGAMRQELFELISVVHHSFPLPHAYASKLADFIAVSVSRFSFVVAEINKEHREAAEAPSK